MLVMTIGLDGSKHNWQGVETLGSDDRSIDSSGSQVDQHGCIVESSGVDAKEGENADDARTCWRGCESYQQKQSSLSCLYQWRRRAEKSEEFVNK